jgi:preprotein translocase subunit SecG
MFTFLLVVHALIAAALVTVILMQRSEGGGLGMGSGPAGLMTARGAADFLSRATGILAALFVAMALLLATLAATRNAGGSIDTSLANQAPVGAITAPVKGGPAAGIPMVGAPTPAAPDPLTAQALAPAAGGPPTEPAAKAQADATTESKTTGPLVRHDRRAPTAADLKTIDTGKAAPEGGVGIQGIGGSDKAATGKPVTAPKPVTPAPTPTNTAAPAPAPSAGSNSQN